MNVRKLRHARRMRASHGKLDETHPRQSRQQGRYIDAELIAPERALDGDFPDACGAVVNLVVGVLNQRSRLAPQPAAARRRPQQQVSVNQQPHYLPPSNVRSTDAGRGLLKSSGILNFPSSSPNRRGARALVSATSLATGLPARAITTSSPASARSTSFDSPVFASWILTGFIGGILSEIFRLAKLSQPKNL